MGQQRKSERKFFPGYVLVQMELTDETWHLVKDEPRVLGFIGGTSERPAPISNQEAERILNRVEEGVNKPRPKVLFEVGEVVRVNDGPFKDFNGEIEEINYEKNKLKISVLIFGRSTSVHFSFADPCASQLPLQSELEFYQKILLTLLFGFSLLVTALLSFHNLNMHEQHTNEWPFFNLFNLSAMLSTKIKTYPVST
jgi:transcription termination/antitermination factor NusG